MSENISEDVIVQLANLVRDARVVAITGAGISTDSGLPDYRGKGSSDTPTVDYDLFISDPMWQRWVWQRNQETWRGVQALQPTRAQKILARWEAAGRVNGVATQNVDGLHLKAGSKTVFELHGSFREVQCLGCGKFSPREELDLRLRQANPEVQDDLDPAHAAILATADYEAARNCNFVIVPCSECGGVLKPAVVFFGEGLPGPAFEGSFELAREADVALVIGTSLLVSTGMWVVREAWGNGAKLVIINRGPTAADEIADLRIEAGASEVLEAVDALL